jgi:hypothetical protein
MVRSLSEFTNIRSLTLAIIGIIILGLALSIFFMIINDESYSALYIQPDSVFYDPTDNSVMYTYGVVSTESGPRDYTLTVFADNTQLTMKQFSLHPGEILDERDRVILPSNNSYPVKISLQLATDNSKEEVHFWIKG